MNANSTRTDDAAPARRSELPSSPVLLQIEMFDQWTGPTGPVQSPSGCYCIVDAAA